MIPESVDTAQVFYLVGGVLLAIGVLAVAAGALVKGRLEEEHRDERYVRERRGEEIAPARAPRSLELLRTFGLWFGAVGILILIAGWTVAPGQT